MIGQNWKQVFGTLIVRVNWIVLFEPIVMLEEHQEIVQSAILNKNQN